MSLILNFKNNVLQQLRVLLHEIAWPRVRCWMF